MQDVRGDCPVGQASRRPGEHETGQHIGLQTDDAEVFYTSLGYRYQPVFMSAIVGEWLVNQANQA